MVLRLAVSAQKTNAEELYLWDGDFKPVKKQEKARLLSRLVKIHDSLWLTEWYHAFGPLIPSEHYKDRDGSKPHGRFIFYQPNGFMDSTGNVTNGRIDGEWYFHNDTGKVIKIKEYASGKLIRTRDMLKEEMERKDSTDGKLSDDEKESEFPGGLRAWQGYLKNNLKYPVRAMNLVKSGIVTVQFIVNTEGSVEDAHIFRSVEYSLDQEAIRMIKASPKWIPAYQKGKAVKSYKRQPFHFGLIKD